MTLRPGTTRLVVCALLSLSTTWTSEATEIYRCEQNGRISFRQTPCPAGAEQHKEEVSGPRPLGWVVVEGPPETSRPARTSSHPKPRSHRDARADLQRRCFDKRQALERLEWRMRHGYKAAKSASLHQRRRAYEAWLSHNCR